MVMGLTLYRNIQMFLFQSKYLPCKFSTPKLYRSIKLFSAKMHKKFLFTRDGTVQNKLKKSSEFSTVSRAHPDHHYWSCGWECSQTSSSEI